MIDITIQETVNDVEITVNQTVITVNVTRTTGGGGGGVESVTGDLVNNTDPLNPIINTPSFAETLAEDNKTNDIPIVSNNGKAVVDVNDAYTSLSYETQVFAMTDTEVQLYSEAPVVFDSTISTDFNTPVLNYNSEEIATQPYADAKVADDLTASTTVAPSKTAVNTALALKQNIPFEIQVTQSGTSAPVIVTGSLKGNFGATITPSYSFAGVYLFTASLPIFANVKDSFKQISNTPAYLLSGAAFLTLGYFTFVVISDTEALLSVCNDIFAPGVTADNLITEPILLELPYN